MTALQAVNQGGLGSGPIGVITKDHIDACNAWLKPLAERDGFEQLPNLGADDIANLLEIGRRNYVTFSCNLPQAAPLRTMLLVDMGAVKRVIVWAMSRQEEEATPEVLFRLTARGRRMLQACCKDLWDKMLYGKG